MAAAMQSGVGFEHILMFDQYERETLAEALDALLGTLETPDSPEQETRASCAAALSKIINAGEGSY